MTALAVGLLVWAPDAASSDESYSAPLACGMPTVQLSDEAEADRHLPAQTIASLRHPVEDYYAQAQLLAAEFVAVLRQRNPGKLAETASAEEQMIVPIALGVGAACGLVDLLAYAERYRNAFTLDELQAISDEYEKSKRMKRPAQLDATDLAKLEALDAEAASALRPWVPLAKATLWADLPPRLEPFGLEWE